MNHYSRMHSRAIRLPDFLNLLKSYEKIHLLILALRNYECYPHLRFFLLFLFSSFFVLTPPPDLICSPFLAPWNMVLKTVKIWTCGYVAFVVSGLLCFFIHYFSLFRMMKKMKMGHNKEQKWDFQTCLPLSSSKIHSILS